MYTGLPTHRRPKDVSVHGTGDSDSSPHNLRTRKKTGIYMYMGDSLGVVMTYHRGKYSWYVCPMNF